MTTDRIPASSTLMKEVAVPAGVIVRPYGDPSTGEEIDVVSYGQKQIVRCKDCRAYVNPFIRFVDNGTKWICNFCGDINVTENYFYSPVNKMGVREDFEDRMEL